MRAAGRLVAVDNPADGWVSPTTGVHVRVEGIDLIIHDSDGIRRWLAPADEGAHLDAETARADAEAARANTEAARANAEAARANALQARLDDLDSAPPLDS